MTLCRLLCPLKAWTSTSALGAHVRDEVGPKFAVQKQGQSPSEGLYKVNTDLIKPEPNPTLCSPKSASAIWRVDSSVKSNFLATVSN